MPITIRSIKSIGMLSETKKKVNSNICQNTALSLFQPEKRQLESHVLHASGFNTKKIKLENLLTAICW